MKHAGSGARLQRVPSHVRAQSSSGREPAQERRGAKEGPRRLPGEAPAGAAQIRNPQASRRSETRSVIHSLSSRLTFHQPTSTLPLLTSTSSSILRTLLAPRLTPT